MHFGVQLHTHTPSISPVTMIMIYNATTTLIAFLTFPPSPWCNKCSNKQVTGRSLKDDLTLSGSFPCNDTLWCV